MICEARSPGNLLNHALHQLYLNWRTSRGRDKRLCWWGRMRSMLRRIWPQCDLHFHGENLISTGNAFDLQNPPLSRARYIEETTKVRWKTRQNALLARQTTDRQQEFILYNLCREFGTLECSLSWKKHLLERSARTRTHLCWSRRLCESQRALHAPKICIGTL